MEQLYSRPYADMLQVLGEADLRHTMQELGPASAATHLRLRLAGRDPDDGLNDIAYEKGCLLLLALEHLMGRPRLDAFITEYFARFAFQRMDTDRFATCLTQTLLTPAEAARLDLPAWLDGPGLPPGAPTAEPARLARVGAALARLAAGTPPAGLHSITKEWSSQEWEHFLRGLPPTLPVEAVAQLDAAFHFTASGNAKLLTTWFPLALRAGYAPADVALENFLRHVGRRKFLVPLYRALLGTPGGPARAAQLPLGGHEHPRRAAGRGVGQAALSSCRTFAFLQHLSVTVEKSYSTRQAHCHWGQRGQRHLPHRSQQAPVLPEFF